MKSFSTDDLYLHQKITDLHTVPGLPIAAACVRSVDRQNDSYVSSIWSFALDGGPARQLTQGSADQSPRWSPDGSQLAFVSARGGAPQLYLMSRHGGEARAVTQFALGVTQHRWAPDRKSILVTAALPADPDLRGQRGKRPDGPRDSNAPEVCWRLPYKSDGVGYMLKREIHLFRVDPATGQSRQLTDGPFDVQAFEPSCNGKHIFYSRTREGRFAHRTDLWVCEEDGDRERCLTRDQAMVISPIPSPDGRWVVFSGATRDGEGQSSLWLLEFPTGRVTPLGEPGLEVAEAEHIAWAADSKSVIVARAWRGRHEIVSVTVPGGEVNVIVTGPRQFGVVGFNGEHFTYSVESPVHACELYVRGANGTDGTEERCVSDLNPWWRERTALELEDREFDVPDGRGGQEKVQGWLLRSRDAAAPLPLLDDAHGGPAAYALLDYDTNVFWQALCSRGWAVLLLNSVGSSTFGREFCDRLAGHWGEYDFPQHVEAVRQLQAEGLCDDRLAISGKSYGGYLTAWAVGESDKFRAAVVMAPVGNIETHYGTSDGGYYSDPLYVDAAPNFDRERARALSPLQYIEKAATPTLFLQGKDDERCPKCQSEELFTSLYCAGDTPTELVLYPGEDHHFLGEGRPSTRADAAHRIVDWVTQHVATPVQRAGPEDRKVELHASDAADAQPVTQT